MDMQHDFLASGLDMDGQAAPQPSAGKPTKQASRLAADKPYAWKKRLVVSDETKAAIQKLYAAGGRGQQYARRFGVSPQTFNYHGRRGDRRHVTNRRNPPERTGTIYGNFNHASEKDHISISETELPRFPRISDFSSLVIANPHDYTDAQVAAAHADVERIKAILREERIRRGGGIYTEDAYRQWLASQPEMECGDED